MSGAELTPPPANGATYRGMAEIVGISVAAVVTGAVIVASMVRNIVVPSALYDVLISIVLIVVARSVKGAQDRAAAAQNIDAAAAAANRVAREVQQTLADHKAEIGAFAHVIAQLIPAAAPVLAKLGYVEAAITTAAGDVASATAPAPSSPSSPVVRAVDELPPRTPAPPAPTGTGGEK